MRNLNDLLKLRKIPESRFFRSWCKICKEPIRTDVDGLKLEMLDVGPFCTDCDGKDRRSFSVPQDSADINYHGGRFGGGEW